MLFITYAKIIANFFILNNGVTYISVINLGIRGVRGREVERRPRNLEVPSTIPGSGCQLWDFFIGPHIRREYWCSSQEAESREISISCKNLFLNRCKINMFKLKSRYQQKKKKKKKISIYLYLYL